MLTDLRQGVRHDINVTRVLERLLYHPDFVALWDITPKKDRERVEKIVKDRDVDGLRDWIKYHPQLEVSRMSMVQLRFWGARKGIPGYSRMTKAELVGALHDKTGTSDQSSGDDVPDHDGSGLLQANNCDSTTRESGRCED